MASPNCDSYSQQDSLTFANYTVDEGSWFPTHPECPNHTVGVPFSTAFADVDCDGRVSCAGCFLHSTIVQSMSQSCHHLHACSNCANCYSQNLVGSSSNVSMEGSPPLFPCGSPHGSDFSSSLLSQESLHQLRNSPGGYRQTPPPPAQTYYSPVNSPISQPRRPSLPLQHKDVYPNMGVQSPQSYSSPSTPYQSRTDFAPNRSPFGTARGVMSPDTSSQSSVSTMPSPSPATKDTNADSVPGNSSKNSSKSTPPVVSKGQHESMATRKRGANDVCEVCGDRASGYHYNALTCEGCKGFFRRTINKRDIPNKCKYGGNCEMDTYTRRKCPDCRLRKCKAVGMLEECLLTEIQCRSKRRSRKTKQVENELKVVKSIPSQAQPTPQAEQFPTPPEVKPIEESSTSVAKEQPRLSERETMLNQVGIAFTEYRSHPEIVKRWMSYFGKGVSKLEGSLVELATIHVQVLVEFVKKLPGFSRIFAEDQIALLKGSVVAIMIMRNSRSYNLKKEHIDILPTVKKLGVNMSHYSLVLEFSAHVKKLDLDDIEYGLLTAIIIFDSDHPHTNDKARIDRYRDRYLSALSQYCERRKPNRFNIFAKMLFLVTKLRTLHDHHAKIISQIKEKEELTPLLCEIWDEY